MGDVKEAIAAAVSSMLQEVEAPVPSASRESKAHRSPLLGPDNQDLTSKKSVAERGRHLFETGVWSDCQFTVGVSPNIRTFRCHTMILAMASPVFEAMLFGGLAETKDCIFLPDDQPEAFEVLLKYVYTDSINLQSFDLVCEVCYVAKKYMLPHLVDECLKQLWRELYPRNACRAYEFAKLLEDTVLMGKSLQMIRSQTIEVVQEPTFEEVNHDTLCTVLSQESTTAHESMLFDAMIKWSQRECERRGLDHMSVEAKRTCLGQALFLIRYLTFTASEFAAGPAQSGILTQEESFAILMNISSPGSWKMPMHMNCQLEQRKPPQEDAMLFHDLDDRIKYYCKRPMMQEPNCLNTSILDCAVTFTVDKDICVHGIEVPSQVTDSSENMSPDIPFMPEGSNNEEEYNELLYAHLLDSDGNRLTYTHFTAKVPWNSMIEITFNRSVFVKAHKVYRVGMVLNKVGWYPMGVCTRRVNCENCFFTFCVGQPNDTLRDGLIRSIIFSV